MEKVKLTVTRFSDNDVIATSTLIVDEDSLKYIWLSMDDIHNFNDIYPTGDIDLSTFFGDPDDEYNYLGFSGAVNQKGTKYVAVDGQNEKPDNLYHVTSKTDIAGYTMVYDWLNRITK